MVEGNTHYHTLLQQYWIFEDAAKLHSYSKLVPIHMKLSFILFKRSDIQMALTLKFSNAI